MRILVFTFMTLVSTSITQAADSNIDIGLLDQNIFSDLIEDLGNAVNFKAVSPSQPLANVDFDLGFTVSGIKIGSSALDNKLTKKSPNSLYSQNFHLRKGLPLGFNVGAYYSSVVSSDIEFFGGELGYAILEDNAQLPELAVRGSYRLLTGIKNLDFSSTGLELSISKGFALLKPYAGISAVWIDGNPDVNNLTAETFTHTKYFAGLNFKLGMVTFAAEAGKSGDNASTSAKIGIRF